MEDVLSKAEEEIDTLRSKSSDSESIVAELEDKLLKTQDELFEITGVATQHKWELHKMEKDHERELLKAKDDLQQEMLRSHRKELDARDELIHLLKEKLERDHREKVYVDSEIGDKCSKPKKRVSALEELGDGFSGVV